MGKITSSNITLAIILIVLMLSVFGWFYLDNLTINHSKVDDANNQLRIIASALERYKKEFGGYPSVEEGLGALVRPETGDRYFKDHKFILDPWRNEIVYLMEADKQFFRLHSFGDNGRNDDGKLDDIEWVAGQDKI